MSELTLACEHRHAFFLECEPELSYRYFAGNEALLKRFLGPERVSVLPDGAYRIALKPHGALGLKLRPVVEVEFIEEPFERVRMSSRRCELAETSHAGTGLDAHFGGEARFESEGAGARVHCQVRFDAAIRLPAAFDWMPRAALQPIAESIVHAAMSALAHRLAVILQREVPRWAAEQKAAGA